MGQRLLEHHSSKLQKLYNEYGLESFNFEIIEKVDNVDFLIETEQKWLDSLAPELNMTLIAGLNSSLGMKRSQVTKDKISLKLRGIIRSEETKNKISKSKLGVHINGANMNKDKLGKPLSNEQKLKIGNGNKGKIRTQETKNKISVAIKNKKIVSPLTYIIRKFNLDGNLIMEYDSLIKAENDGGYKKGVLYYNIIKMKKNEYNNFKWVAIRDWKQIKD